MDTNLALTIIGSVLTVIGVVFIAIPKVVNEKTIDGLPTEAVNIAAVFRSANGGLGLVIISSNILNFSYKNIYFLLKNFHYKCIINYYFCCVNCYVYM